MKLLILFHALNATLLGERGMLGLIVLGRSSVASSISVSKAEAWGAIRSRGVAYGSTTVETSADVDYFLDRPSYCTAISGETDSRKLGAIVGGGRVLGEEDGGSAQRSSVVGTLVIITEIYFCWNATLTVVTLQCGTPSERGEGRTLRPGGSEKP
jgi:hypothetical protein